MIVRLHLCLLAAVFLICPAVNVHAATYFDSGNKYWEMCARADAPLLVGCVGTAAGYMDMMVTLGYRCDDAGLTRGQVKDVLLNRRRA